LFHLAVFFTGATGFFTAESARSLDPAESSNYRTALFGAGMNLVKANKFA
jgi:hypothetical protein